MTWVRVRDRATGHQYDVDERALDPAAHARLNSPRWPDLPGGPPRQPLHHAPLGGIASRRSRRDTDSRPAGDPSRGTT